MTLITRKEKITLISTMNENDRIVITINIEANHVHNQLDMLLETMRNLTNNVNSYKLEVKTEKPKKAEKPVKNKKSLFVRNGNYV
jgi:hypothetical protein